jgi:hypothetical protein
MAIVEALVSKELATLHLPVLASMSYTSALRPLQTTILDDVLSHPFHTVPHTRPSVTNNHLLLRCQGLARHSVQLQQKLILSTSREMRSKAKRLRDTLTPGTWHKKGA